MLVKRKLFKQPTFFFLVVVAFQAHTHAKKKRALWILKFDLNVIQLENGKLFPFSLFNIVNVWSFIHQDDQQSINIPNPI